MTTTLYYLPLSMPCRSVLMLVKILDIELDLKLINPLEGDQLKPEYVQMNPQHTIPTIDDQGLILWESRAILSYFAALHGKDDALYPKDLRVRAMVDQRMQFDLATLYQRMFDYYGLAFLMGAPLEESKMAKLREAVGWFDTILKGKEFAACDHFTIADLTLLVTTTQMEALGFDFNNHCNVKQWMQRCKTFLEPYDYENIIGSQAVIWADVFQSKL